jgi:hypothetical protein
MNSLSSLLGNSKKQGMFRQAYVISVINNGLEQIQTDCYPDLNQEFKKMDRFIIPGSQNDYKIKFRIQDNGFKTFVKTEINSIYDMLHKFLDAKGLDKLLFEIIIT